MGKSFFGKQVKQPLAYQSRFQPIKQRLSVTMFSPIGKNRVWYANICLTCFPKNDLPMYVHRHDINELEQALAIKDKRKKPGRALQVPEVDKGTGGAVWWSPRSIKQCVHQPSKLLA
jgi:hypothetical protein